MKRKQNANPAFAETVMRWYHANKRNLPWRHTADPYLIWLSEIILQQTRVDQGLPYYEAFARNFPNVRALAKAPEDRVLKLWQGLGYYSRARNLHATAKQVCTDYKGRFPADFHELQKLKGVGAYTAAAVASLAFGLPHAVVDGNVYRLLARYFGIKTPVDSSAGKKEFSALANRLIDPEAPGIFNQAVMEFGAIQCRPVNPACERCPLCASCFAFAEKKVGQLPVKAKKTQVKTRHLHYLVISCRNFVYMKKRNGNDIWKGLYDFPLLETKEKTSEAAFLKLPGLKILIEGQAFHVRRVSKNYRHVLSHQVLHARFFELEISKPLKEGNYIKVKETGIGKYPLPRLVERYLQARG